MQKKIVPVFILALFLFSCSSLENKDKYLEKGKELLKDKKNQEYIKESLEKINKK